MLEFLKWLFTNQTAQALRDELRAKNLQIESLQAQIDRVLALHYDRPAVQNQAVPDDKPALPVDTLCDMNIDDDEKFVEQMQKQVYEA